MVPNCLLAPSQSTVLDREFERIIIGAANVFLPLNFFMFLLGVCHRVISKLLVEMKHLDDSRLHRQDQCAQRDIVRASRCIILLVFS